MQQYLRARLYDTTGAPELAVPGYAKLLAADPGDTDLARRTFRAAMDAGDMALALATAKQLDAAGTLPADGRLLLLADAVKRKKWDVARQRVDQIVTEDNFNYLAPILSAWINFGAGKGETDGLLTRDYDSALTTNYAQQHRKLLLLAEKQSDTALGLMRKIRSSGTMMVQIGNAIALASRLQSLGKHAFALEVLQDGDPVIRAAQDSVAKNKKLSGGVDTASKGIAWLLIRLAEDIYSQRPSALSLSLVRTATWLDPGNDVGHLTAGHYLFDQKSYALALDALTKVNQKGPWLITGRDMQVDQFYRAGQIDNAVATAQAIVENDAANASNLIRLGDLHSKLGNYEKAAEVYGRAVDMSVVQKGAADWSLWLMWGGALEQAGDWPRAQTALKKAVELAPNQPVALNYLGYSQLEHGENLDGAMTLIQEANRLYPDNASLIDSLGWGYFLRGDIANAVINLEIALSKEPNNPEINEHMGDAYWAAGRKVDARYAWNAALILVEEGTDKARIRKKLDMGLPDTGAK